MSHPAAFTEIAENLSYLDDWEDRYKYIIELGQALPPLADAEKNAVNKVNGCVSQVWLVSNHDSQNLVYRGESDAMITRPGRGDATDHSATWCEAGVAPIKPDMRLGLLTAQR